jgi:PRTRC genetic system protein A
MKILADDPTAAAILTAVPCYPIPQVGRSPAIEELRSAPAGEGVIVGRDGVMLVVRRPWLEVDALMAPPLPGYVPYGSVGRPRAMLRCGLIPGDLLDRILAHFITALPNEAAAFVLWNAVSGEFDVHFPDTVEATPSRLVYRPPAVGPGWYVVCDIHSHGRGRAFFSSTDDVDDAHSTKIALVVGRLDDPEGAEIASRLCAGGMFLPMPRSPFAGEDHDA